MTMNRKEYRIRNEVKRLQNLLDFKREQYELFKLKQKKGVRK